MATLVGAAGDLARLLCEVPNPEQIRQVCGRLMPRVGLPLAVLPDILHNSEPEIAELASLLHLDIVSDKIFAVVADAISESFRASPV